MGQVLIQSLDRFLLSLLFYSHSYFRFISIFLKVPISLSPHFLFIPFLIKKKHKRTPSLRRQAIHATLYPSAPNSPATPTTTPPHLSPNSSPLHLSPHHPSSPHRKRSVSQQSSPSPPISSPSSPPHQPPTCVSLFASPSTPPLSSPSTPPISVEYSLSSAPPPSPRHALLQKVFFFLFFLLFCSS